jgi:hypothetical protein
MGNHWKVLFGYFLLVIPDVEQSEAIRNPAVRWIPGSRWRAPRNDGGGGVLNRHCADGKTPLLVARLCKAGFGCQNAAQPE